MSWQKLSAIWGVLVTIAGTLTYLVTTAFSTYTMVVDIHSQYATREELAQTYLKTRVDDFIESKGKLEDLVKFYETKRDIEDGLTETEKGRLVTHRANLQKLIDDFEKSIED
tara:strand:+ start:2485 stop:2820 length:336 start_codon:yes stop_codon:yes gene_type:complete